MAGFFLSNRSLWLLGSGALGALAVLGLGKLSKKGRPAAVGVAKEGIAFSDWIVTKYEKMKEDAEDIIAEAKHEHQKDRESKAEIAKKEEDILRSIEEFLKQRTKKEDVS